MKTIAHASAIFDAAKAAKLPAKPFYKAPCNHCGLCCMSQLCPIGELMFPNHHAPCPALLIEEGQARCAAVLAEGMGGLEPVIAKSLGIGCGCSMADSTTTDAEISEFNADCRKKLFPS